MYFISIIFLSYSLLFSSPVSVTDGGTGLNTMTNTYAVLIGGTTSVNSVQTVANGTSGQVLTSNGAGAAPSWTKNNGLILIRAVTASSSSAITFTSSDFNPAFSAYMLVFEGLTPSSSTSLRGQWSTDNGSSYIATGYSSGINIFDNTTTVTNLSSTTELILGTVSSGKNSAAYFIFGMNGNFAPGTGPVITGWGFGAFNPVRCTMPISTVSNSPNVNNLTIYYSGATIVNGRAYLYGLVT